SSAISLARCVLRPSGPDRRSPRDHQAVARCHPYLGAGRHASAQPRAPRALPVGPAAGGWRAGMTRGGCPPCPVPSRRLSHPFRRGFWRVFGRFSEAPESRTIPSPREPNRLKKAAIVLIVPKVRAAPPRRVSSIPLI